MFQIKEKFERYFNEALWDLETAEILHREKYNAAAFYVHQATEVTLKMENHNNHN